MSLELSGRLLVFVERMSYIAVADIANAQRGIFLVLYLAFGPIVVWL